MISVLYSIFRLCLSGFRGICTLLTANRMADVTVSPSLSMWKPCKCVSWVSLYFWKWVLTECWRPVRGNLSELIPLKCCVLSLSTPLYNIFYLCTRNAFCGTSPLHWGTRAFSLYHPDQTLLTLTVFMVLNHTALSSAYLPFTNVSYLHCILD